MKLYEVKGVEDELCERRGWKKGKKMRKKRLGKRNRFFTRSSPFLLPLPAFGSLKKRRAEVIQQCDK